MVYFTSRRPSTNVSTEPTVNGNMKDERHPIQSKTNSKDHAYHFMSPILPASSCTDDNGAFTSHLRPSPLSDSGPWTPSSLVDQGYKGAPSSTLHSSYSQLQANDTITKELMWMTKWALLVCLVCPVCGTLYLNTHDLHSVWFLQCTQPLLVIAWGFLILLWHLHHPAFFTWAQCLCLLTLLSLAPLLTTFSSLSYALLSLVSLCLCLFHMVQRLIHANTHRHSACQHDPHTAANEVQEAALLILATFEQVLPSLLLTTAPQQLLSACSVAIPITSISAIHTALKQLCHISSHPTTLVPTTTTHGSLLQRQMFDIGELCQNVGDCLAGLAAKLDVNLVLYHSDSSLHHTRVTGDEATLRYALLDLLRNILEGSTPGACIEIGLNVVAGDSKTTATLLFDIIHTCSSAIPDHLSSISILLPASSLAAQLINSLGGLISVDNLSNARTRFKLKVEMDLEDGSTDDPLPVLRNADHSTNTSSLHKSYHHIKFANEPTIQELSRFMGHLKGLKMVLHAKEQSVFAKHLTGCLASWNCDISHVSVSRLDDTLESSAASSPSSTSGDISDSTTAVTTPLSSPSATDAQPRRCQHDSDTPPMAHAMSPFTEEEQLLSTPPAFVLIDDHLLTLERTLLEFRTRSSPEQRRPSHGSTTAILHFTSMANYNSMRDIIQWASTLSTPYAMPRIVVVPKPSGPRRYLTALHTAWHNAMVEPHYIPIATSPISPVPTVLLSSMLSQVIDPSSIFTPEATQHQRRSSSVHPYDGGGSCFERSTSDVSRRRSHQHDLLGNEGTQSPHAATEGLFTTMTTDPPPIPPMDSGTLLSTPLLQKDPPELCPANGLPTPLSPPPPPPPTDPEGGKPVVSRTIRLVRRRKKDKGSSLPNAVSPPIHVLIVEDNMINQAILSAWMKKHKIKFSVASNGQEAVEKWKGGGFHLVLMDIQLPVMSGIEATRAIRSIEKDNKIGVLPSSSRPATDDCSTFRSPVIIVALTASSLECDRHAALAAGCNDFLTKPVSLEWLEKKIVEWGCMQALIDFEGWRRWKRSAHDVTRLGGATSAPLSTCPPSSPDSNNNETKTGLDGRKGIVLPGAIGLNKRRGSTVMPLEPRARGDLRRKALIKKSFSLDDYMRSATFAG